VRCSVRHDAVERPHQRRMTFAASGQQQKAGGVHRKWRRAPITRRGLLHSLPGRLHLGLWPNGDERALEAGLLTIPGVHRVEANPRTGYVLILFDQATTDQPAVLAAVGPLAPGAAPTRDEVRTAETALARPPRVLLERQGDRHRARIIVRGISRDAEVAQRVVKRLERHPGVRARPSPLTGRVVVEFEAHRTELEALLAAVTEVELPELPGEDRPTHPLDPAPLLQGAVRTVAAGLGLGTRGGRRGPGRPSA